ncbi:MAG: TrkA C-terminal domain-containing protein, partial [Bacteroidales bacterium]
ASAGFSAALGAFVMGSILAETLEAEKIEKLVKPVKDLFGAIFFVSVGMMIDPALLATYWLPILLITLVVVFGQIFFASFGILLSGQPLKIALQSGFALAQIGEFAFIIAALGLSLNVIDSSLYPIVVAVSVITTFFTPYIIRLAEPAYLLIDKKIPPRARRFLERYASGFNTISHKSTWNKLLKELGRILLIYGVTAAFITFLYLTYLSPLILDLIGGITGRIISLALLLLLISPLLRAIMMKKNHSEEFMELWRDNRFNRGSLVGLVLLRILLCIGWVMFIIARLFTVAYGFIFGISVIIILLFISSRMIKMQSIRLERHFLRNLSARETEQEKKAPVRRKFVSSLLARDLHLADFEVQPASPSVGKMLKELDLRRRSGVNVVKIIRGERHINIPGGNEHLYPFDKIVVAGTDKQIGAFRRYIEERNKHKQAMAEIERKDMTLEQFVVEANSVFVGKSIMQSHIRDKANCLVIGIERQRESIMNPESTVVFQSGDLVWVVGERDKLEVVLAEANRQEVARQEWVIIEKTADE